MAESLLAKHEGGGLVERGGTACEDQGARRVLVVQLGETRSPQVMMAKQRPPQAAVQPWCASRREASARTGIEAPGTNKPAANV